MRRSIALHLVFITLLISTGSCAQRNRAGEKLAQDTQEVQKFDSNLTFNNVTLVQSNEKGQLWWRVKAKQATYSKDQRNAVVQQPKGELFQDGKPVFRIEGLRSEVQQDGKSILLKGQITATDIRDGSILKGNEVEWRPTEDVLVIRNSFTGNHKQMQLSAKEGRFLTRARKIELMGQIVAIMKQPDLRLRTDQMTWEIQKEKVMSDRPVQVERYQKKVLTDRGSADKADVDLKTKIVNFRQNAKLALKESNLQVSGNLLSWNVDQQRVNADQPVTIVNPVQQVTLTADKGDMVVNQRIAHLKGNVRGEGQKNQSRLSADQVTWFLATQQFQAEGNVNYRQNDPPFSIAGPKAAGRLDDQQVAVDGGRVELQIVPEGRGR